MRGDLYNTVMSLLLSATATVSDIKPHRRYHKTTFPLDLKIKNVPQIKKQKSIKVLSYVQKTHPCSLANDMKLVGDIVPHPWRCVPVALRITRRFSGGNCILLIT